jgi:spore coat polysaccharide biosynthesis predicted glycosyltransferase SpsG
MRAEFDHDNASVSLICEASSSKGVGQLKRSAQIADCLRRQHGLRTYLYILGERVDIKFLDSFDYSWLTNEEDLVALLYKDTSSALCFDIFPERQNQPLKWLDLLDSKRHSGIPLIGFDRCVAWADAFDRVIVPSIVAPKNGPDNVKWGWEFIPTPKLKPRPSPPTYLLVLTGGSDTLNYGETLPALLDEALVDGITIRWVQGPYANAPKIPKQPRKSWIVTRSPENLEELLKGARAALTVYGLSFFECISASIPTALLPSHSAMDNNILQELVKSNVCHYVEEIQSDLDIVNSLWANEKNRDALQKSLEKLPLGDGIKNIAAEINKLLGSPSL